MCVLARIHIALHDLLEDERNYHGSPLNRLTEFGCSSHFTGLSTHLHAALPSFLQAPVVLFVLSSQQTETSTYYRSQPSSALADYS